MEKMVGEVDIGEAIKVREVVGVKVKKMEEVKEEVDVDEDERDGYWKCYLCLVHSLSPSVLSEGQDEEGSISIEPEVEEANVYTIAKLIYEQ